MLERWLGLRVPHTPSTELETELDLSIGYEMQYDLPQPTPMILMLNVHYSRISDLRAPDHIRLSPAVPITGYRDLFGNWCARIVAPEGRITISTDTVIQDSGLPDPVWPQAGQSPVENLPEEALVHLMPSRFCESDRLMDLAWQLFGNTEPGWPRVQAVCDYVHNHIRFDYMQARPTRTACEGHEEQVGVCRDFAHLAVAFCRALNIPARYCTGYLGDVGTPRPHPPGDFAAWFEAWLGGEWCIFDPRNNVPRLSRVLIARGRDAADVAIATTFGPHVLSSFKVWTDEVGAAQ